MRVLYRRKYPIRRMRLIDAYGSDDRRSMAADNTSAFNCRFVAGTTRWSMHAYGTAIDLNPIENPYVAGSHVSPPAGRPYADRSSRGPRRHPPRAASSSAPFAASAGSGAATGPTRGLPCTSPLTGS